MQKLRIFTASASDTTTERAKVETAATLLKPLADKLGIVLDVIDWRSVLPDMGRPEQVILDQLGPTEWDVFIGILWHRFGTPPGGHDTLTQKEYQSGTEEEFKTAYRLWETYGKPRIMMYRCTRPLPFDIDPDQLKRVREFFTQFEAVKGEHQGLYQSFETTEAFERLLIHNLQRLLLDYGEQIEGKPTEPQVVQTLLLGTTDNLPRRTPFFGRDKEIDTVLRALSPADRIWGVLVDGIGGIGKTALAVESAHRCKEKGLFEAYIFVSAKQNLLAPGGIHELMPTARTLDEFFNETARLLGQTGIMQLAGDDKRRALLDKLRVTPTLLLYDNLETLTKEEQEAVAYFLRELPTACKAIITSRRRGGEGAEWLRLEKLEWEAARQLIAEEARKDAGLNEKMQRAGEARWPELYDETKGSPLMLSHTLGLMRVRASLTFDRVLEMLRGNRDANLHEFIFQEARRELTTNDQAALRALSFFAPSAEFDAWREVAQMSRNALETTIDRLSALSLVDVLAGAERFALHPMTRNFVRDELLSDPQVARETGMLFAEYWAAYAQRYGGSGEDYKKFPFIEAEWANLDAATEWLWQASSNYEDEFTHEDAALMLSDMARDLCSQGGPLFYLGRWDESLQLASRVYESMRSMAIWTQAGQGASWAAWIHITRGNTDEAKQWADCGTRMYELSGDKLYLADGMRIRGMVARDRKDYDTAEQLLQDGLKIQRDMGSERNVAVYLHSLGVLERERKNYDTAEQYHREALALFEKIDSKHGVAFQYQGLGRIAMERDRPADALVLLEKALPLAREIRQQSLIVSITNDLAHAHEAEGRFEIALSLAQEAMANYERLHYRLSPEKRAIVERLKNKIAARETT